MDLRTAPPSSISHISAASIVIIVAESDDTSITNAKIQVKAERHFNGGLSRVENYIYIDRGYSSI